MTQAEVAERICADAKMTGYGSLSVFRACYASSRIMRFIAPEHFTPKPKVNSATFLLEPLSAPLCENSDFFAFIRAAFSQKRKTLANSLSAFYPKEQVLEALKRLNFSQNIRAEELSPNDLLRIFSSPSAHTPSVSQPPL